MMKVACVLLLLGVASAAFGPAATGSAGSATGGATGGSPPQCHMQTSCGECIKSGCSWSVKSSLCQKQCLCTGESCGGDSACIRGASGDSCPATPGPTPDPAPKTASGRKNCQTEENKLCRKCVTTPECVFTPTDGCLNVVQLSNKHVVTIREKGKCPVESLDCSLKGTEGCKECNTKGCEWSVGDKKCVNQCFDDDKCARTKDKCPPPSNPLLRKTGPRFVLPGGLDLH